MFVSMTEPTNMATDVAEKNGHKSANGTRSVQPVWEMFGVHLNDVCRHVLADSFIRLEDEAFKLALSASAADHQATENCVDQVKLINGIDEAFELASDISTPGNNSDDTTSMNGSRRPSVSTNNLQHFEERNRAASSPSVQSASIHNSSSNEQVVVMTLTQLHCQPKVWTDDEQRLNKGESQASDVNTNCKATGEFVNVEPGVNDLDTSIEHRTNDEDITIKRNSTEFAIDYADRIRKTSCAVLSDRLQQQGSSCCEPGIPPSVSYLAGRPYSYRFGRMMQNLREQQTSLQRGMQPSISSRYDVIGLCSMDVAPRNDGVGVLQTTVIQPQQLDGSNSQLSGLSVTQHMNNVTDENFDAQQLLKPSRSEENLPSSGRWVSKWNGKNAGCRSDVDLRHIAEMHNDAEQSSGIESSSTVDLIHEQTDGLLADGTMTTGSLKVVEEPYCSGHRYSDQLAAVLQPQEVINDANVQSKLADQTGVDDQSAELKVVPLFEGQDCKNVETQVIAADSSLCQPITDDNHGTRQTEVNRATAATDIRNFNDVNGHSEWVIDAINDETLRNGSVQHHGRNFIVRNSFEKFIVDMLHKLLSEDVSTDVQANTPYLQNAEKSHLECNDDSSSSEDHYAGDDEDDDGEIDEDSYESDSDSETFPTPPNIDYHQTTEAHDAYDLIHCETITDESVALPTRHLLAKYTKHDARPSVGVTSVFNRIEGDKKDLSNDQKVHEFDEMMRHQRFHDNHPGVYHSSSELVVELTDDAASDVQPTELATAPNCEKSRLESVRSCPSRHDDFTFESTANFRPIHNLSTTETSSMMTSSTGIITDDRTAELNNEPHESAVAANEPKEEDQSRSNTSVDQMGLEDALRIILISRLSKMGGDNDNRNAAFSSLASQFHAMHS